MIRSGLSPSDTFRLMINGYWVSQALCVVARLGIADLIQELLARRRTQDRAEAAGTRQPRPRIVDRVVC